MEDDKYEQYRAQKVLDIIGRCEPHGESCITWTGAVDKHGYGRTSYRLPSTNKGSYPKSGVHRVIYIMLTGKAFLKQDKHIEISHLCGNKLCCNINHLHAESGETNKSRNACFRSGHCSGHPSDLPNCLIPLPHQF